MDVSVSKEKVFEENWNMEELNMLNKARNYEKEHREDVPAGQKPAFHFSVPIGWSNDPNGFSFYDGKYHLFYQYNPYDKRFGKMHWGHCVTSDFIKWEYLPAVMAPEEEYDRVGCFSGSAIEKDGRHVLMYTGVGCIVKDPADEEKLKNLDKMDMEAVHEMFMSKRIELRQVQCIAVGDGKEYTKIEQNPVITGEMLPEGASLQDFRDPKVWVEDGRYYTVIGGRDSKGDGQILLYSSNDLLEWVYEGILYKNNFEYGTMWECPDFFLLDGKAVLMASPMELSGDNRRFSDGFGSVCVIGNYKKETHQFEKEQIQMVDYGLDYYAPQSLETPDGRRIQIGWFRCLSNNIMPQPYLWNGMMTIPRELHIREGKLYQLPVNEIKNYYSDFKEYKNIEMDGEKELEGISGRYLDMTVDVEAGEYEEFCIEAAKDGEFKTSIFYHPQENLLTVSRTDAGMESDKITEKSAYVREQNGKISLRVLMDNCALEVFANDGEQAMSTLVFTPEKADGICFRSKGKVIFHVAKYRLMTGA